MAGRTLERLQQRYNSSAAPEAKKRGPMPQRHHGPGAAPAMGKPKDAGKTIGRIFSYIGKFWPRLIVVALCLLLSTAATMVGGYLLRPILNQVADVGVPATERVSALLSMLIVLLSAYLVAVLATFLQYRLMVGVSQSAVERIRHDLFEKLQKLPVRYFDSHNNGEIMSRFTNDVDNIGTMLDNSVISMISGAATLLGTLVIAILKGGMNAVALPQTQQKIILGVVLLISLITFQIIAERDLKAKGRARMEAAAAERAAKMAKQG